MKPEALDALTTHTMRPTALEAVTTVSPKKDGQGSELASSEMPKETQTEPHDNRADSPTQPSTPFGERTDGTESAAKVVEDVVQTFKTAVDEALAWAERKANEFSSEQEGTGPYSSPGTCMPSDLDAIASGILPAMPAVRQFDGSKDGEEHTQNEKK